MNLSKQFYLLALFLFFLLVSQHNLIAQTLTISGKVTDAETGEAIIGANIIVKGSANGTVSDLYGTYTISANSGEILLFSYVGYLPQEVIVTDRIVIDIALEIDIMELEELVVIGYGTQKKEDLTGSVTVVDADEMRQSNYTTFDKALQGRAAGVHVSSVSGKPGETAAILIRGIGSISRSAEPLIIVDGMPVNSEFLNSLNPDDVESAQVLKDASATAIYGARGANGVIMITTRKGRSGPAKIDFSAKAGINIIPRIYDVMNAAQYVEYNQAVYEDMAKDDPQNMYYKVYCDSARISNDNYDTDTDWQDEVSRIGKSQNYNLSASGGNEYSNFYVAGNYSTEEGILINTDMTRLGLTANSNFNVGKRFIFGESLSYSTVNINDVSNYGNGNAFLVSLVTSPLMPLLDETAIGGYGGPTDSLTGINERTNPVAEQMLNDVRRNRYKLLSTAYMNVELARGFTYTIRVGANINYRHDKLYNPIYTLGNMRLRDRDISKLEETNYIQKELQMNHQFSFTRSFGNNNINAIAVWERFTATDKYISAIGTDLTDPDLVVLQLANTPMDVDGTETEHRLESYLARILYNYAEKYYITISHRIDGSTRFGPEGGRYGHFPSFSLGWRLNEDLLRSVDQINMLKLRFGWGATGNENLEDYQYFALLDPPKNSRYIFGVNQDLWMAAAPTSYQPNPLIRWESAKMTNFGVDFNAFGNRLQITAEYYIKNQDGMLVSKPISVIFGKKMYDSETPKVGAWVNLSRIQNRGFEFTGSWRRLEGDFNYSISANLSTIKNEVIDLVVDDIITDYTRTITGHTIGSFYGFVAERIIQESDFDQEGNYLHATQETRTSAGDIKFKDLNRDGKIDDIDRTIIGKPLPDIIYGLNFTGSYKGLDLVVFLQGMQNLQVYSSVMAQINIASGDMFGKDQNRLVDCMDYWTPDNPSTTMTRINILDDNMNSRISSWYLYDASFIRLKTLQIGYTFAKPVMSRPNVDNLRVFVSSNNLYTLTRYPGYDPEIGSNDPLRMGIDGGGYPVPRSFTAGISLKF